MVEYVDGTSLCLEISKIKIGSKIKQELIDRLEHYHQIDPVRVFKNNECFIVEGYCLGTIARTLMYVVIRKNENCEYIRGTRGDECFKKYKAACEMYDFLTETETNYL